MLRTYAAHAVQRPGVWCLCLIPDVKHQAEPTVNDQSESDRRCPGVAPACLASLDPLRIGFA
jgi:hypothetical protein